MTYLANYDNVEISSSPNTDRKNLLKYTFFKLNIDKLISKSLDLSLVLHGFIFLKIFDIHRPF